MYDLTSGTTKNYNVKYDSPDVMYSMSTIGKLPHNAIFVQIGGDPE